MTKKKNTIQKEYTIQMIIQLTSLESSNKIILTEF